MGKNKPPILQPLYYGRDVVTCRIYALFRFVVLAADAQVARSILLYQSNLDKISHLAEDKALACAGPQSDCVSFTEYVSKNMALYELNNDVRLTTKAAATFIRGEVRESLISLCGPPCPKFAGWQARARSTPPPPPSSRYHCVCFIFVRVL